MKKSLMKIFSLAIASLMLFGVCGCKEEGTTSVPEVQEPALEKSGYKLVNGGLSEYVILLSDDSQANETLAAQELQGVLYEATGAKLSIVYEDEFQISEKTALISIGNTDLAVEKGVLKGNENLNRSGYVIKTDENRLFIAAEGNALGCVYAVYDLLEDVVGYRYYHSDEIYYEQKSDVELYKYDEVVKPTFDFRSTWYPALDDEDYRRHLRYFRFNEEYGWKAHQQTWTVVNYDNHKLEHGWGATKTDENGEKILDENGAEIPDHWFSNNGEEQLCWTAGEEMEMQAALDIYGNIKANPDKLYFQIGQADNTKFCTCERCLTAIDEWGYNNAGLQINWANRVVELVDQWVQRDYPEGRDVRIVVFAYMGTEVPPVVQGADGKWVAYSDKVQPHKKLYFEYAPIFTDYSKPLEHENNKETYTNLIQWNDLLTEEGRMSVWTYETNFSNYMYNFNNFHTFQVQMKTYAENGIDNMFSQGASLTNQPCFQEMRLFVESQLMWDIDKNYGELVEEFMTAFYKDAAPEMEEYYDFIRMRYEQAKLSYNSDFSSIYSDIGSREIWSDSVVDAVSRIFAKAYDKIEHYKTTNPEMYRKLYDRIKELEVSVMFTKLSYYRANYSQYELNAMIDEFNYYTAKFGITLVKEHDVDTTTGMFDAFKK